VISADDNALTVHNHEIKYLENSLMMDQSLVDLRRITGN
jgi:hypothetical protein